MGPIGVVLLVAFVVVCVLLVLLVAMQDDGQSGMGGILGGRSTAAFGSHSASMLTKTTFVLVVMFFVLAFGLALVNKKPAVEKDLVPSSVGTEEVSSGQNGDWWSEAESAAPEMEMTDGEAVTAE